MILVSMILVMRDGAKRHVLLLFTAAVGLMAPARSDGQLLPSPTAERCAPAVANGATAAQWLERAAAAVLPRGADGKVLRYRGSHDTPLWEQSDRMYEPFVPNATVSMRWVDPVIGVEGRQAPERPVSPRDYATQLYADSTAYVARDTVLFELPAVVSSTRPYGLLNPWLVLGSWRASAAAARVAERCRYRDAWRVVLALGSERLYLSESDATPIKLQRVERHYLWGQVKAEYLWTTWWGVRGGGYYPNAAFRLFDGAVYERSGVSQARMELVPRDSAPRLERGQARSAQSLAIPTSDVADTVRISEHTFLLVTRAFTEAVTLQRDTVFLFDATSGEARARADSAWVAQLFPGAHPVVLVVTDLAWPHVSGVRFWVARGAIIASHRGSESFLRRIVDRRWTLEPDALEGARATARFRFRAVDDSLRMAGGAVVLHALRNTSTEMAIGAWVPADRFFWAGDYVQSDAASPYARGVVATLRALAIEPLTVGAQHVPQSDWSALEAKFPLTRP
jgi:hypothetical protein